MTNQRFTIDNVIEFRYKTAGHRMTRAHARNLVSMYAVDNGPIRRVGRGVYEGDMRVLWADSRLINTTGSEDLSNTLESMKRDNLRLARELKEIQNFRSLVTDTVRCLPEWPAPPVTIRAKGDRDGNFIAVWQFGDWHGHTGWVGNYLARADKLMRDVRGKLTQIFIVFGGDMGESTSLHQSMPFTAVQNMARMAETVAVAEATIVRQALSYGVKVDVFHDVGNHLRTEGVRAPAHHFDNWDLVAAIWAEHLQPGATWHHPDQCERGEVSFAPTESSTRNEVWPYYNFEFPPFIFGYCHGKDVHGYRGIPWYGIERYIISWLMSLSPERRKLKPIFFVHHFHREIQLTVGDCTVFMTASTGPMAAYAAAAGYLPTPPSQNLITLPDDAQFIWGFHGIRCEKEAE